MFILQQGLWGHPDVKIRYSYPVAYQFGILWQDKYMETHKGISFKSEHKIADAYNRKVVGQFLANNVSIAAKDVQSLYSPLPIKGKVLRQAGLFHYLNEDYTDFMNAFDRYMDSFDPFRSFATP